MDSPLAPPAPAKRNMSLSFPPDQPFVPDGVDQTDGLSSEQRREAQRHLTRVHQHSGEVAGMEIALRETCNRRHLRLSHRFLLEFTLPLLQGDSMANVLEVEGTSILKACLPRAPPKR